MDRRKFLKRSDRILQVGSQDISSATQQKAKQIVKRKAPVLWD
jgi:hypothetical protein